MSGVPETVGPILQELLLIEAHLAVLPAPLRANLHLMCEPYVNEQSGVPPNQMGAGVATWSKARHRNEMMHRDCDY
jgi:hypothetical protein